MVELKPIRVKRASDQIFEQLRDLIFRGELKPGEQLVPERELAQAFGVSRPTVREAINKLVTMGLVEHRQGQGTFVRSHEATREHNPLAAIIGQETSLEDLLEVRMGLEAQSALLAAERATPEDIQRLEETLAAMEEEYVEGRLGIEEDVAFHMDLAYATKNPVQVYIMRSFHDLLHFGIEENLRHLWEDPANLPIIRQQHRRIFQAIKDHDPEAAYEAMKAHITFVLEYVRGHRLKAQARVTLKA